MPAFDFGLFAIGCVGGIIPDILRFIKTKFNKEDLKNLKSLKYWVVLVLSALMGGFVTWLLGAQDAKDAFIFGFTASEVISRLVCEKKEPNRLRGEAGFRLRAWWAV